MRRAPAGSGRYADADRLDTIPKLLLHHAAVRPQRPAMREKKFGIWQTWTWRDAAQEVRRIASLLRAHGFVRGDRLAVIGDNRPRLYFAMVAAQAQGGLAVPLYPDAGGAETERRIAHAGVRFVVAENQEQVDKLLEIRERMPVPERIFYLDARGLGNYRQPFLHDLSAPPGRAPPPGDADLDSFAAAVARGKSSDAAGIYYTSGTDAPPKGVVLRFENILGAAGAAAHFEGLSEREQVLAWLPMASIGDHMISVAQAYCAGFTVNCAESPATVLQDLREIGPTYFFAPPRIWENIRRTIERRMADAGGLKRRLYTASIAPAGGDSGRPSNGATRTFPRRALAALGAPAILAPLRNVLGMSRVRLAYTSGEAISPATFDFFRALGINIKQVYGATEGAMFITVQHDREACPDTVGRPLPGVAIALSEAGEVLFRSLGCVPEYHQDAAATAALTRDGWIRTGDTGRLDSDGTLSILDRSGAAGTLADGTPCTPAKLEIRLRSAPDIKEAVVFGPGRPFVAALVAIDAASVGNWAERQGIAAINVRELAARPEVIGLIRGRIEAVNRGLAANPELATLQVRRFLILSKEFDPDDGELTRTQKLRRRFVAEKYAPLVDRLYAEGAAGEVAEVAVFPPSGATTAARATTEGPG